MNNKIIKNKMTSTGLHILGEVYTKDTQSLKALDETKMNIPKIIREYRLKELGSFYYQFSKGGFTGIISLVESHIAIHTWPELGYLTLDVYLCNHPKDNSGICEKVFNKISKTFKPFKITKRLIKR